MDDIRPAPASGSNSDMEDIRLTSAPDSDPDSHMQNDENGFWMDVYDYEETPDFSLVAKKVGQRHILNWGMFNAFHPSVHQRLADHEELSSFMCELKRGEQFKYFTAKHSGMAATGARLPKGGAPGDAYDYYAGFEVESLAGIHRAFDYAEDGLFLLRVAEFICSSMATSMREAAKDTNRLGLTGHNLFWCNGYLAGQHHDVDEGWSLCCQIRWWANRELREYSFCEPQLGYFWRTRPNVAWSFNSDDMHGTMLPGVNAEFPPPQEFIDSMGTPAPHILARSQPENAALARDRDNRPGWPMQRYLNQQRQNRQQQQAPNQAGGGPAAGQIPPAGRVGPRVQVPGRVSTGNHVCVPRRNALAARRAERAIRTRDANFAHWDNRGAGH
ncbi:hypothetical protein BDZ89DRAFT_1070788 [Hymenopellis radicata]|nr:hypothetical protein BDZ89DRAFT_1070788 [Hymenopellis radicata]